MYSQDTQPYFIPFLTPPPSPFLPTSQAHRTHKQSVPLRAPKLCLTLRKGQSTVIVPYSCARGCTLLSRRCRTFGTALLFRTSWGKRSLWRSHCWAARSHCSGIHKVRARGVWTARGPILSIRTRAGGFEVGALQACSGLWKVKACSGLWKVKACSGLWKVNACPRGIKSVSAGTRRQLRAQELRAQISAVQSGLPVGVRAHRTVSASMVRLGTKQCGKAQGQPHRPCPLSPSSRAHSISPGAPVCTLLYSSSWTGYQRKRTSLPPKILCALLSLALPPRAGRARCLRNICLHTQAGHAASVTSGPTRRQGVLPRQHLPTPGRPAWPGLGQGCDGRRRPGGAQLRRVSLPRLGI